MNYADIGCKLAVLQTDGMFFLGYLSEYANNCKREIFGQHMI